MSSRLPMTPDDILGLRLVSILPLPVFLLFVGVYYAAAPHFGTEKKRAYVLSTLSSVTMSLISLPFFSNYVSHGFEYAFNTAQTGWLGVLSRFGVVFFGTYLFADLSIGYFKYRSQVGLLTGWIHHICYIFLMIYCVNSRQSPIFMIAGVMEIPTFDLAISNLFPQVRHDFRFLASFFLVRIAFHLTYLVDCLRPSSRAVADGSFVPVTMLTLAFVLHASWFHGGVNGYLKRARAKNEIARAEAIHTTIATTAEAGELEGHGERSPTSLPGTPEDSPLVTPHTPSMNARDSYLPSLPKGLPALPNLPNLPNLANLPSIPNIPQLPLAHIPTVSMPTFSDLTAALHAREQMNWGFKDAVKSRWEEQRERFNGIGRGGLRASLGGIRLRRRGAEGEEEHGGVIEVVG